MSYIIKNKLVYHSNHMAEERPVTADINLTNYCNQSCDYCRYKQGEGYMDFELFKKVIERLLELGVEGFILTGGGEPLINPDIDKIINYLEDNNLPYGVNTNFMQYKDINPVWMKVSFDAVDEGDFIAKRGVDGFNLVKGNVDRFKKEHPDTTVGIQGVILDDKQVKGFYNAVKDLNVDYISFRPLEINEQFYNLEELTNIQQEVDDIDDKRVLYNYKWDYVDTEFEKCFASWSVLTINYNGDVFYCCHKPEEVVGNIFDVGILEKKKEFDTDMNSCETPCRLTGNNLFLNELKEGEHIEFV